MAVHGECVILKIRSSLCAGELELGSDWTCSFYVTEPFGLVLFGFLESFLILPPDGPWARGGGGKDTERGGSLAEGVCPSLYVPQAPPLT